MQLRDAYRWLQRSYLDSYYTDAYSSTHLINDMLYTVTVS